MPGIDRGLVRPVEPTELFDARSGCQELESKWFWSRWTQSPNSSDDHRRCAGGSRGTAWSRTTDVVVHEPDRPSEGLAALEIDLDKTCRMALLSAAKFKKEGLKST